ncbi:MAG: non-ribosomal peptide synthetase, partial [Oscillospiraceae bacterium]|nr:non-ribosomal peptide synthetase [Oscillospiraceae bacterium]
MRLFHELIADYAAAFPGKAAVTDTLGEMSYGEMEARSASVSRALAARGVGAGDAVAVYVPYVKEILLGAVSAFRAGAVFVPFDFEYPPERLAYMRKDSEAKAVLTLKELWEQKPLDFPPDQVVFMDEPSAGAQKEASCAGLTEESPAMLLYTSGTTGNPKGVPHIHGMLLHLADWIDIHADAAMNADTRSGVITSFSFVGTQMFLLGPLSRGGTVCIAPEAARKDLGTLYQFLGEQRVTHIFLPSGLAAILAEDYDITGRFIFAAGEKLRNFRPLIPGSFLIDSYGSTETSGVLSKKVCGDEKRILVGKPFVNTKARIADEALRPVKPGEPGELLISSGFMARRYWKLPELSAEKWIELDGETWFRTGDRAVLTAEGDYDILGRIDSMVKLRGFRIETGEVEAQIASAAVRLGRSDVKQIVVAVRTVGGMEHLVCYYEAPRELDRQAVTEEISKTLTEYMIPKLWVRMDALPRNANGKVLRKELPQPKRMRNIVGELDSEVIFRLVFTAANVLDLDFFVWPDDRFTDLGGTSLSAMQYALALREQGIKLSGAQVLRLNSFRKMAEAAKTDYARLWSAEEYEAIQEDFAARGEHIQKVLPISTRQDEMLYYQLIFPDSRKHLHSLFLQIDSAVSEAHLREALDVIAEENEELRSAVVFHNVGVVRQVITDRKLPLTVIREDKFGRREMEQLQKKVLYAPVDLQSDSMMRMVCAYAEGMSFLFVMSHGIAVGKRQLRGYLARMMGILEGYYPEDASIRGWKELLEAGSASDGWKEPDAAGRRKPAAVKGEARPDICVYSDNGRPGLVFVHTGNTGSETYYRLADRLGDRLSFAVIEPFNLYHP